MNPIEKYVSEYSNVLNGAVEKEAVCDLLSKFGVSNPTYQEWLTKTGGGPIGPDWYDSLDELEPSQKKLKEEDWTITGFVIGWDGCGNPIVLDQQGEIKVEDHTYGGVHEVAKSFDELLEKHTKS